MKILKSLNLDNVVFLDIETTKAEKELTAESPLWEAWKYKCTHGRESLNLATSYEWQAAFDKEASLFAEFGKIACITIGKIKDARLSLKSYASFDEAELLNNFCRDLNNIVAANKNTVLCGHAIKGFDIPWLMRRCLVNRIELPVLLDNAHLKPWEQTAVDTAELWKAGGFNGASLISITTALGLTNPKDELEGCEVSATYYSGAPNALELITTYCEKDVLAVANVVRVIRGEEVVTAGKKELKEAVAAGGPLERSYKTGKLTKEDGSRITKNLKEVTDQKLAEEILKVAIK